LTEFNLYQKWTETSLVPRPPRPAFVACSTKSGGEGPGGVGPASSYPPSHPRSAESSAESLPVIYPRPPTRKLCL